jgi:benzoate/toluate 1,2-dioxygenase subunit beta
MATRPEVDAAALAALLLRERVEGFLFREARLLDEREYTAWLALYADDATYWIPSGHDDADPMREVSIVYDRHSQMRERVWRLESGLAYAQEPSSRTAHVIANVEIAGDEDGQVTARSTFVIAEFRRERRLMHAGRCLHHLRPDGDDFLITLKKVDLVDNDGHLGNLSVLL